MQLSLRHSKPCSVHFKAVAAAEAVTPAVSRFPRSIIAIDIRNDQIISNPDMNTYHLSRAIPCRCSAKINSTDVLSCVSEASFN